jgi:hypothetical protein
MRDHKSILSAGGYGNVRLIQAAALVGLRSRRAFGLKFRRQHPIGSLLLTLPAEAHMSSESWLLARFSG